MDDALRPVVIVGGGPVGAAAALGLARAGHAVTVLEARASLQADDRRTLAIAYGSQQILAGLGAWPDPADVTPITRIHVSQRGRFGQTVLTAEEAAVPALGYVLRYNALVAAQAKALAAMPGVTVVTGATVTAVTPGEAVATVTWQQEGQARTLATHLAVLADGGRALTTATFGVPREQPYAQVALVAKVSTDQPHEGLAYERFTPQGPLALLPFEDHYALVWTGTLLVVEGLLALSEAAFLARLQEAFGHRAGQFLTVTARSHFPLTLKVVREVTRPHVLCIGNAAQTMHPVAGQGFNLGLRDAAALVAEATGELGGTDMLGRYRTRRQRDRRVGIAATHALVSGFSNDWPGWTQLRGQALNAMNLWPWSRRALSRLMMFGAP